ncbi:hypothetical protein [Pseudosporangium ferrugineum]|uniref:Uncharacterized protein n=1 Tax=Pseudosporangium ferrugineum TaxID=439699 RepID=A0A2T0RQH8_9ACTN|nr:hypothetical protein [Pseudosporangium ferrugineum]PRY23392.1 hypothetical protein CLV70_115125 [Pseudosporangium ferrugineum]
MTTTPVDREGMTPGDYLGGQLFNLSVLVIPGSLLVAAIDRTWTFSATAAGLAGTALLVVALFCGAGIPQAVRASGRPHLVKYSYLGAVLFGAAAAAAFMTLERERLFPVPVPAVVAVAAIAVALQLRSSKQEEAEAPAGPDSAEDWPGRLTGLLIGRYDLPPERAAELAEQARTRAQESGRTPAELFGPAAEYARRLQEDEPVRQDPFWRTRPARIIGLLVGLSIAVQAFIGWQRDGVWWAAWLIAAPAALGGVWYLVRALRDPGPR